MIKLIQLFVVILIFVQAFGVQEEPQVKVIDRRKTREVYEPGFVHADGSAGNEHYLTRINSEEEAELADDEHYDPSQNDDQMSWENEQESGEFSQDKSFAQMPDSVPYRRFKRDHHSTTEAPKNESSSESQDEDEEDGNNRGGGGGRGGRGRQDGGEDSSQEDNNDNEGAAEENEEEEPETQSRRRKGRKRKPRSVSNNEMLEIAANCQIAGYWYNKHGSEMLLRQTPEGIITGEYRTGVESKCGSAGESHSNVFGYVHGDLVTFHVPFTSLSGTRSMTTWIGQCHQECDFGFFSTKNMEQTVLHTTWVLTDEKSSCDDAWGQSRIGQNIFIRKPITAFGPRRNTDTHTPERTDCADSDEDISSRTRRLAPPEPEAK